MADENTSTTEVTETPEGNGAAPAAASKRESKVTADYRLESGVLYADFKISNGDSYTLNLSDLSPTDGTDSGLSMEQRILFHGSKQKVIDNVAGLKVDGEPASIEDISSEIGDIVARLQRGEWGADRKAGTGASLLLLAQAIAAFRGIDVKEAAAKLSKMSKEQQATVRAHEPIAKEYTRLQQERAAKRAAEQAPKVREQAEAILANF